LSSSATSFGEAAKAEGYEQETESSPLGNAVLWTLLVGIIVTLGIGVWTIVTRITVEVVVVALLLAAFWFVPAILILRWRERRRKARSLRNPGGQSAKPRRLAQSAAHVPGEGIPSSSSATPSVILQEFCKPTPGLEPGTPSLRGKDE
jgi:hypothetical protein